MALYNSISPEALKSYLHSPDFRAHYSSFSDDVFEKILRYGYPVGSTIECHVKIPRCMDRLKEMIADADDKGITLPSGTVIVSHELQNGCGRFDRFWHAPQGGLWMAVAMADILLPEYTRLLPLAAGIACCEAIRSYGVDAAIKWVNDIHVCGRKIGGILCETCRAKISGELYHLIGIGINCNVDSFPSELKNSAVSMHEILEKSVDLDRFALNLLGGLVWNFGLIHLQEERDLEQREDMQSVNVSTPLVIDSWRELSDTIGRSVRYGYDVVRQPLYRAEVIDVDQFGGLMMRLDDGSTVTENSGEIIYLD